MFKEKWCIEILSDKTGTRGYYAGFIDGKHKLESNHHGALYFNSDVEALAEMEMNGHEVVQFCIRKFFHNVNR